MRAKGIVFLILLASLFVACGKKDNKANGNGITTQEIQTMQANLGSNNFQAVSYDRNYSFTSCVNGYQSGDWKSFSIPNYSNNCRTGYRKISTNGQVTHSQGQTEAAVKAYLDSLLSRVVEVKDHTAKNCYIEFKADDGYIYIIDRTHPLITNPVSRRSENGSEFYMYSGYRRPFSDQDCNNITTGSGQTSGQQNTGDFDFLFN